MRKAWITIAGLAAGLLLRQSALAANTPSPVKMEETTPEADKAAAHEASAEADQWAGSQKPEEKSQAAAEAPGAPAQEPATALEAQPGGTPGAAQPSEVSSPKPAPAAETAKPAPPRVVRPDLNEMKGKLQSKSSDPRTFRLLVDGGINVEFTYDGSTSMVNGGSPITMDDLDYMDELIVRYQGKELHAVEIDRIGRAPRPQ